MGWGTKETIGSAQAVGGTELYTSLVLLNPGELAHIQVVSDSSGTTSSLVISVYGTLDSDGTTMDAWPLFSFTLDTTSGNPEEVSFVISGIFAFKVGFVRDTGSDTLTTSTYCRKDGVNL